MILREYVPQSLRDAWHAEFEQLRQGAMIVSEYAVSFSELARHALALVATIRERVRRFIEGLFPSIRTSMARELEMNITYQKTVSIARRVEGMLSRDKEKRKAKRSRETGHYSEARAPATRYGKGFVSLLVHSALPAVSGVPAPPRPQEPYYAPPVASLLRLEWRGTLKYTPSIVIYLLKAQRMVEKGCDAYLSYVRDVSIDSPTIESVLVVRDFLDVFPANHSSMPPDRDIDSGIDLLSGTQPISIPPDRMDLPELKELKEQLQELLDKGFKEGDQRKVTGSKVLQRVDSVWVARMKAFFIQTGEH
ncbi:uncharacterized protein [Nicotiana tomentosiformis]|uniref:uncharacterized protein n=1 Tax=Nicotiana tomentosiformis TaxID=4098 RepID=UPI00388C5459